MFVRHQKRQTKAAQKALDRTFPVAFIVAHLQQFTGKRHVHFRDTQCLAHGSPHGHLFGGDIISPGFQADKLDAQSIMLLLALAQ